VIFRKRRSAFNRHAFSFKLEISFLPTEIPRALHLHHDAVPPFENVVRRVQIDRNGVTAFGVIGSGFSNEFRNRPRKISSRDHQFIPG